MIAHAQFAREVGVTDAELEDLAKADVAATAFTPAEKAALRYTDEMIWTDRQVSPETFSELQRHFTPEQIVEMTILNAFIAMIALFNRALDTDPQDFTQFKAKVEVS